MKQADFDSHRKKFGFYDGIFFLVLSLFTLLSFSTMGDFGITWDEPAQHHVGKVSLDYLTGNTDGFNFLRDDLTYYGPFFEMANQYFGPSFIESFSMGYVESFHVLILLAAITGLFFLFKLASGLFGKLAGVLSVSFLILHPVFFANAQYNSKDIPLFCGITTSLYLMYAGFLKRKVWKVAAAGAVFGLTLATRIDALFLLPVFFLPYILFLLFELKTESAREWKRHFIFDASYIAAFFAASGLLLFAAWPALWKNPAHFFSSLAYFLHHGWPGKALYFGTTYAGSTLPWHYAPFYILATMPFPILALAATGFWITVRNLLSAKQIFASSLVLAWLVIRPAFSLFPGSVKYDGVRHFLAILPSITILASLGFLHLLDKLPARLNFPAIGKKEKRIGIAAVVFIWLFIEFFWIFPFGGSYYNEVARLAIGPHIEKKFDFEYWGASYRQGMDWLNGNAAMNSSFCVPVADHLIQFYPVRQDLKFDCSENSDYLMFITRWAYLPPDLEQKFHFSKKVPIYKISRYNSDLLLIYKLK